MIVYGFHKILIWFAYDFVWFSHGFVWFVYDFIWISYDFKLIYLILFGFRMILFSHFFWQGLLGPPQVNPTRPDPSVGGHAPAHQHPANAPTPWWQRVTKGEPSRPWSATAVMLTVLNCRTHPCLYWITPHRAYMYIMTCEARSSPFMLP